MNKLSPTKKHKSELSEIAQSPSNNHNVSNINNTNKADENDQEDIDINIDANKNDNKAATAITASCPLQESIINLSHKHQNEQKIEENEDAQPVITSTTPIKHSLIEQSTCNLTGHSSPS